MRRRPLRRASRGQRAGSAGLDATGGHDAVVETVAQRTVELLLPHLLAAVAGSETSADAGLVDATALAERLGVTRAFVYEHADELGAIRLGDGPRARLRFDVEAAERALPRSSGEKSLERNEPMPVPIRGRRGRGGSARLPVGVPEPGSILASRGKVT